MNGFSDRGSTPLSSITKEPWKHSVYAGFGKFRKCETGCFRPKKTSLNHTNWGITGVWKTNNVRVYCVTKEARKSLSSPLPKALGEWGFTGFLLSGIKHQLSSISSCSEIFFPALISAIRLPIMSSPKSFNFRLFFKYLPHKTEQKMYDSHCILYWTAKRGCSL